jgi:hypothetical protein
VSLKEEIGGIIYDADIYKNKVTCGQLNGLVDDITKTIVERIDVCIDTYEMLRNGKTSLTSDERMETEIRINTFKSIRELFEK